MQVASSQLQEAIIFTEVTATAAINVLCIRSGNYSKYGLRIVACLKFSFDLFGKEFIAAKNH